MKNQFVVPNITAEFKKAKLFHLSYSPYFSFLDNSSLWCFLFIIADDCEEPICGANVTAENQKQLGGPFAQARSFEPRADALLQPAEDGALMASYSVFVVEPGAPVGKKKIYIQNGGHLKFYDKSKSWIIPNPLPSKLLIGK